MDVSPLHLLEREAEVGHLPHVHPLMLDAVHEQAADAVAHGTAVGALVVKLFVREIAKPVQHFVHGFLKRPD